ncbi:MAG TPA: UDP-N-acetylglucosamine--N-acetylmuramyl-(pentapeptide) pyrophosphoryl-undecaprenol N-acetylglucosamine transferase, partial [Marinilabiliales bacterium]|nr:UDP-N-acetylglucosamine--N-acetylmuramyl-(pentapeptide) pyrophosphoryl-undecaprenol N-acetylglucosamine transferase [Marinilabiliales bacterium]
ADFIISRAGAGTISELCIVGKPVILVPSPNVAEDHQTRNAMALVSKNAAILVKDKEAKTQLIPELFKLASDDQRRVELGINIQKLAKPHADDLIVDEIYQLIS